MRVELPVLVAVAAEPAAAVVMPFVGEAHGNAVVTERPDLLDQAIVELALPFARQELLDLLAPLQKLRAVPPARRLRFPLDGGSEGIVLSPHRFVRSICSFMANAKN